MLVIEIAAGIVLGALTLLFLRQVLTGVALLAGAAAVLVVGAGLIALATSMTLSHWEQLAVSAAFIAPLYPVWRWLYWPREPIPRGDD